MKGIADFFYETAQLNSKKEALWCDGVSFSYEELACLVSQHTNFLLHYGVRYGDHISILMNNSVESVVLMLSAADIGAVLVPVNPTLPIDALRICFESGDVKHLIARSYFYEQVEKKKGIDISGIKICMDRQYDGTVYLAEAKNFDVVRPDAKQQITGEEDFIITMTSGSTGSPKPIDLTQNNKIQRAFAHIRLYGITSGERILAATPLYHSLAERLVLMPLMIGATSILLPRYTPQLWLNCIKEQRVSFTIAVSAQLKQVAELLTESEGYMIDTLRCVVSSSALLDAKTKETLMDQLKCDFHEMYGTSEISTATDIDIKNYASKKNSVGRALEEADIKILDAQERSVEPGEIGEIACKTKLICNGYYKMPQIFSEALHDGYFKTGDLGYMDGDGFLYFAGRKKELIITGGINVYPADIEACIVKIDEVHECAAFPYPDERLGEVVAVAVVVKEGATLQKRSIQIWCARNLADFQQPHEIFFVDELPKNSMGKVVKTDLLNYVMHANI